jgi:hypothetical protein
MLDKIKELVEQLGSNLEHRGALSDAMKAIGVEVTALKERVEGLAHEATGDTGAAVAALGERLDSLTSAVSSIGSRLDSLGSLVSHDGTVTSLSERIAALEAKAIAPAPAPELNPAPYAPAPQQTQQ